MAGTIYATKEELTEAVVKLVYPNTTKSITGLANQTAILNVVESLWAQLGGGGTGGLQEVLDIDSVAAIPGDFNVTANGTQLLLNNGALFSASYVDGTVYQNLLSNPNGIEHQSSGPFNNTARLKVGDLVLVFEAIIGSEFSKYTQDPSGFTIESQTGVNNGVGGKLTCGAGGFKAAMKNTNSGGVALSIIGYPDFDRGFLVSREYEPVNEATALWDIDGDLRVRTIDQLVNDTYPLTVDSSGNVHKGVAVKVISTFSTNSTLIPMTNNNGDGGRRVAIATSPDPKVVTIPLNLMLVGQEQTVYQLGAGSVSIIGPDVDVIGSATTTNPGDKITIFRAPDNLSVSGQVYIIS